MKYLVSYLSMLIVIFCLLVIVVCVSCSRRDWGNTVYSFDADCTPEQYAKVETQTKFCIDQHIYNANACYDSAFSRNCKQRNSK